jgi:hypothetical protein
LIYGDVTTRGSHLFFMTQAIPMKCHPRHKNLPLFISHVTCHISGVEALAVLLQPDQATGKKIQPGK